MQGKDFSEVRLLPHKLDYPKSIKEPSMFFVNAFSDLFHEKIPDYFRNQIFRVMSECPQHRFQILTKRARQMKDYVEGHGYLTELCEDWVWYGVSVESPDYMWRVEELLDTSVLYRFISFEPLLAAITRSQLETHAVGMIDWIIVGGESDYKNPRPMNPDWAREIRDFAATIHGIPFFFKQWGGKSKCKCHNAWGCRLLDGKEWSEYSKGMIREN